MERAIDRADMAKKDARENPEPVGWMVCISMETRESAEDVARTIQRREGFFTHLRPIYRDADNLESPGPRIWK
jgi:hypothetical protein